MIEITSSGHLHAHACTHGHPCVLTYAARKLGDVPAPCALCARLFPEPRQLTLFRGGKP